MSKEKLQKRIEELKNIRPEDQKNIQSYQELLSALGKLNQKMDAMYTKDHESYPPITLKDKEQLFKLYQDAGAKCESLLDNIREDKNYLPIYRIVNRLLSMLSSETDALKDYDPEKKHRSLPMLLTQARTQTLDLGNVKIASVGGNTSHRIPFSYIAEDGVMHTGLFTEKKEVDPLKAKQDIVQEINLRNKEYHFGDIFYHIYEKWIDQDNRKNPNTTAMKPEMVNTFMYYISHVRKMSVKDLYKLAKDQSAKKVKGFEACAGWPSLKDDALFKDALKQAWDQWNVKLKEYSDNYGILIDNGYIWEKCRIDSRNTAMSRVAEMLGKPELVAHAESMKVKVNGKEIEGTFMDLGKGMDLAYPTKVSENYKVLSFAGKGLKSVADLQVLDFICGNTDRHGRNMVYQFDTSDPDFRYHEFLGVQGIDNDLSFGIFVPKNETAHAVYMNSIASMRVISRSMANAVMALTPELLKYQLRDLEMTDRQLHAAGMRLQKLKDAIVKSDQYSRNQQRKNDGKVYLAIIPDENFSEMEVSDLRSGGRQINQFNVLEDFHQLRDLDHVNQKLQLKEISRDTGMFVSADEKKKVAEQIRNMINATVNGKTSDEYEGLLQSLRDYHQFVQQLSDRQLAPAEIRTRKQYMQQIRTKAIQYLGHKSRNKNFAATNAADAEREARSALHMSYATKRIDLAADIAKWAESSLGAWTKTYPKGSAEYESIMETVRRHDEEETIRFNMEMRRRVNELRKKEQMEGKKEGPAEENRMREKRNEMNTIPQIH